MLQSLGFMVFQGLPPGPNIHLKGMFNIAKKGGWDMVGHWIYQAMCLIVFWVKTRQHPDICHKTHEKLFQSVVIITVIFVGIGMGKKGQGWHRVNYSTYCIVIFSHIVPHTLLGICKGLIWGLLNLSFRLLNVISSMAGCFKGVVTLLLSRLAPPG